MEGYHNYSMSNNAVEAYRDGEKPKSKWTKASILTEIQCMIEDEEIEGLDINVVSKLTKNELIDTFLVWSSWHHTSLRFNKTEFFRVEADGIDTDKVLSIIANRQPKEKNAPVEDPLIYADIEYGNWEGTRKHPQLVMYAAKAVLNGNWVYILDGKRLRKNRKHLAILKTYRRKPKSFDTDAVKRIRANLK